MLCNGESLAWLLGEIKLLLLDVSTAATDRRGVALRPLSSLQFADGTQHPLPILPSGRQIDDLYLAGVQDGQEGLNHLGIELGPLPVLQFLKGLLQTQ